MTMCAILNQNHYILRVLRVLCGLFFEGPRFRGEDRGGDDTHGDGLRRQQDIPRRSGSRNFLRMVAGWLFALRVFRDLRGKNF